MKPKSKAFRPGVSGLEPRAMMSVAEVAPLAATPIVIAGRIQGRYQAGVDRRAADVPLRVNLNGNGNVQGPIKLVGSIDVGGFRPATSPQITGTVRLVNKRGSITLALTSQDSVGKIPKARIILDATVVGGTGIYSTIQGSGTASAAFAKSVLRAKSPTAPVSGTATYSLNLNATVG
ncbi:hypothetical protein TA3x_002913 [Tundrisphaera sp. TA3]|uniref:hypothetical protein n=1 Tax=Tundrisphaera sp. TA3 TaxID=3435775 RepID=UPI003EB86400